MLELSKRKIRQLSGGMKRRVGIAQALVGNPRILVVDEPTAGLDPEERVRFRGLLSRYAREGRTVLLSTHIVEDVHQLCGELAVLRKGRLFYYGNCLLFISRQHSFCRLYVRCSAFIVPGNIPRRQLAEPCG